MGWVEGSEGGEVFGVFEGAGGEDSEVEERQWL